jgi:SDR family mycofactocin-dependent oxidoreductase
VGVLDGRVAFITGAARGQGRTAAVLFAEHGAKVIAADICESIKTIGYPLATEADLAETVRLVEVAGGEIVARRADVRDRDALQDVVDEGVAKFGRLDFVLCNAGVFSWTGDLYDTPAAWTDTMEVNARGAHNTVEVALPTMIGGGHGGSIVMTNSLSGLAPMISDYRFSSAGYLAYMTAKHGLVGLMRAYALMLAQFSIRVNSLHPGGVATPMIANESVGAVMTEMAQAIIYRPAMPMDHLEPSDVANASLWLCSDNSRYVTGTMLPIDGGAMLR